MGKVGVLRKQEEGGAQIAPTYSGSGGMGMLGDLSAGLLTIVTAEGTKDLYKYRNQIKGLGEAFKVIGVFAE